MNSVYISLILILIIAVVIIIKSIRISPISDISEHFISKQIIITDNLLNVKDASEKTLATIAANATNSANAGVVGEEYMFVDSRNLATIIDDVKRTNIIDK